MQRLERTSSGYALVGERRPQPGWLAVLPLTVLAVLPWLGPEPITAPRVLTSALLFGLVLALLVRGRPRAVITPLARDGGRLRIGKRSCDPASLVLSGVNENWTSAAPAFRADLRTTTGNELVLEGPDPALVMSQAEELARWLDIPLDLGWGMTLEALPVEPRRRSGSNSSATFRAQVRASQRAAGITSLCCTIFVAGFSTMLLTARLERGLPVLTLSLVLPTLAVLYGLVVSVWLLGLVAMLTVDGDGFLYDQAWFGRVLLRRRVRIDEFERAYAVGPTSSPTHVLVSTGDEWLAFRFVGTPANAFVTALMDSTAPTRRPDKKPQASGTTRFSSASAAEG